MTMLPWHRPSLFVACAHRFAITMGTSNSNAFAYLCIRADPPFANERT
jgi:hypothetical protein